MNLVFDYLYGVVTEGVIIALLFWVITYITLERSSLWGAVKASLVAEAVANLPYLFGEGPLSPVSLGMAVVGAFIFIRLILRVGELSALKASYGVGMTYFALIAIVSCS